MKTLAEVMTWRNTDPIAYSEAAQARIALVFDLDSAIELYYAIAIESDEHSFRLTPAQKNLRDQLEAAIVDGFEVVLEAQKQASLPAITHNTQVLS
jgi:hypothetical protein